MDIKLERSLLASISGAWAGHRNFSGFRHDEVEAFLKLQAKGMVNTVTRDDGSQWVFLSNAGIERLCQLNSMLGWLLYPHD